MASISTAMSVAATTTYATYRALNSSSVTVLDQFGVTWINVLVLSAVPSYAFDPLGWVVSCDWLLLPQST